MIISSASGYILLIVFLALLISLAVFIRLKQKNTSDDFFCFEKRNGKILASAVSIAASWIWAPALFIGTQIAYEKGVSGLFWFLIPNILALASFAFFGKRIKKMSPNGWNLPEFLGTRFQEKRIEYLSSFTVVLYQLMAVIVQLVAGSYFLELFTGILFWYSIPILAFGSLLYSLLAGFQGTVKSDIFQYLLLLGGAGLFVYFYFFSAHVSLPVLNFSGISGSTNVFDPEIFFSFGLLTAITLFAGALADQQYWQRSFSLSEKNIPASFLLGSILFGMIPLGLSFWGFLAAGENIVLPEGIDAAFIGVFTMSQYFSEFFMMGVFVVFLAGLTSTLDSAYSAFSTLFHSQKKIQISPPKKMFFFALLSVVVSLFLSFYSVPLKYLWWTFNGVAVTLVVPTVFSLVSTRVFHGKNILKGMISGMVLGIPIFFWGQFSSQMSISLFGSFIIVMCNIWGVLRK